MASGAKKIAAFFAFRLKEDFEFPLFVSRILVQRVESELSGKPGFAARMGARR